MKIFRRILLVMTIFLSSLIFVNEVYAASASFSVSSSSRSVIVGNTFKVTITLSSSSSLGSWEFDVKYDTSKLSLISSTLESSNHSVGVVDNSKTKSKSYTLTFKAKASGTAKIYVDNSLVYGYDENVMKASEGSVSVNVMTQEEVEASYSSDNTLKSLTVSDYNLEPKFDKNTLEYSLEDENDVREISVSAKANDSKADVDGTGKHTLEEGNNKITIRVTAENGNVKNYVINVLVKELDPIKVEVDGKEYTVVRKIEDLDIPTTFTTTTTILENEEIPSFESSITGYKLIALKDEEGNIEFFIYNEGEYILYEERVFNGVKLYLTEPDENDIPEGYKLSEVSIGGVATVAYINDNGYPLVYGVNVETGKSNWYSYDEEEMTLQRYTKEVIKEGTLGNKSILVICVLGVISLIQLLFIILINTKMRKKIQ